MILFSFYDFFVLFILPANCFFATPAQFPLSLLSFIALFAVAAAAAVGSAGRLEVQVPAAAAPVRSRLQRRQGERCRAEGARVSPCRRSTNKIYRYVFSVWRRE